MKKLNGRFSFFLILFLLYWDCSSAQNFISTNTRISSFVDNEGNRVSLNLPYFFAQDPDNEARLIGMTRGYFKTLYHYERRVESYEESIRSLCYLSGFKENDIARSKKFLENAGLTKKQIDLIYSFVEIGAKSINKRYVAGDTVPANIRNELVTISRKLNRVQKSSKFKALGATLTVLGGTFQISDIVLGTLLYNSLSTDLAFDRCSSLEDMLNLSDNDDLAIKNALNRAKLNILASQNHMGSFALYVNDNLDDVVNSTISLGAGLFSASSKIAAAKIGVFAVSSYIAAPIAFHMTLSNIADQWELGQNASTVITLTGLIEQRAPDTNLKDIYTNYGKYKFAQNIDEALSTVNYKIRDFIRFWESDEEVKAYLEYLMRRHKFNVEELLVGIQNVEESVIAKMILIPNPDGYNLNQLEYEPGRNNFRPILIKKDNKLITPYGKDEYSYCWGKYSNTSKYFELGSNTSNYQAIAKGSNLGGDIHLTNTGRNSFSANHKRIQNSDLGEDGVIIHSDFYIDQKLSTLKNENPVAFSRKESLMVNFFSDYLNSSQYYSGKIFKTLQSTVTELEVLNLKYTVLELVFDVSNWSYMWGKNYGFGRNYFRSLGIYDEKSRRFIFQKNFQPIGGDGSEHLPFLISATAFDTNGNDLPELLFASLTYLGFVYKLYELNRNGLKEIYLGGWQGNCY